MTAQELLIFSEKMKSASKPEIGEDLPDSLLRTFACDCAERALLRERSKGREPDECSWSAVRISRLFSDGLATKEELASARDSAWAPASASEKKWQARRLSYLCFLWAQTCRGAMLLRENNCPYPSEEWKAMIKQCEEKTWV